MQNITYHIRERFAKKNMSKLSIGAFSVKLAKTFSKDPKNLSGYIKYHQLFLFLSIKEDKTFRFLNKPKIIDFINKKLEHFGYNYVIRDLRMK